MLLVKTFYVVSQNQLKKIIIFIYYTHKFLVLTKPKKKIQPGLPNVPYDDGICTNFY